MDESTGSACLEVVVVGLDDLAVRLIEGLRPCSDLRLAGVHDEHAEGRRRLEALGLPPDVDASAPCDVRVVRRGDESVVQGTRDASITVPGSDGLAVRRVVAALDAADCPATRIYLLILERSARVDCLTPRFGTANDTDGWLVGDAPSLAVQRVRVPYDRSNVHVMQIDLRAPAAREDVLAALRAAPHVILGRSADGLPHTAAVQERRRDGDRPSGDGPEIFVWEESVAVEDRRLYLTVDVCPFATPVPEILEAVRAVGAASRSDPRGGR